MAEATVVLVRKTEQFPFRQTSTEDWYVGEMRADEHAEWRVVIIKVLRAPHQDHFPSIIDRIQELVVVWNGLSHPRLLPVLRLIYDGPQPALVQPFIRQDLHDFLTTHPDITPEGLMRLIKEILEILAYLHDRGVYVGIIWARGIMIDDGHVTFPDIGHQYMISSERKTRQITTACRWLAPELIGSPEDFPAVPTAASDVYSTAITIYEMHTLRPPYRARNNAQFIYQLQQGTVTREGQPDNMAPAVWEVLQHCLQSDPSLRPTARQLLARLEFI